MAEHTGFTLDQTVHRSIVRLRVRPGGADAACKAIQLPQQALQCLDGNPAVHWLGPDQWLLTSESESAVEILEDIDRSLSGQLYAATDMSSELACFSLSGPTARTILAMGCGIDMHPDSFTAGRCVRTRFAQVPLFMVAVAELEFDLYVDRSYSQYLHEWLTAAGEDPITQPGRQSC